MLANRVTANQQIGNNRVWTDPHANPAASFSTSCHFATVYWLFWDEFSRPPNQNELVKMGNAQLVVGKMLPYGVKKTNPAPGHLTLTTGSVLIFAENNTAGHSCIATAPQSLEGYNQGGWFSAGGQNHAHSSQTTNQLMWGAQSHRNQVHRVAADGWYELYEVLEPFAKAVVRNAAQ